MNKILFNLLCLSIALLLVPVPVLATDPSVMIADYSVTPAVLMPGDIGTITAIIRNTATSASIKENTGIFVGGFATTKSTDINVNIESVKLESTDVQVISGNYKRVGEIGPGQSIPITFLIRAPAKDGIYFPEIWIDVTGGQSVRQPIPVNVNTQITVIKKPAITVTKIVPASVRPGDDFDVTLILANNGLSRADDIFVSINASTASIAPKSPGNYRIDTLLGGKSRTLDLSFSSDKKAPLGLRTIEVAIDYANPDGSIKHQVETVGIPIKGRADIGIASLTTEPSRIRKGDPVTLIIRLENTGTDDAKSTKASIDLPMSGSKDAYVGKIEPNNDAPAVFNLQADNPGNYEYTLTVQYSDDYGTHINTETLTMTVLNGSGMDLIVVMLIVLIAAGGAGYYWFVVRKKGTGNV